MGAAIATLGLFLLVPRVEERRALKERSRGLRDRRLLLIQEVRYTLNVEDGRTGLTAKLRF